MVHCDVVPEHSCQKLINAASKAVGVNSLPLDVIRQVTVPVSGVYETVQEFLTVKNLTVDCLLGADFLKKHKPVVYCGRKTLCLNSSHIPIVSQHQIAETRYLLY